LNIDYQYVTTIYVYVLMNENFFFFGVDE